MEIIEVKQTCILKVSIDVGLTGEDWEPTDFNKYYAQLGKIYAFGPTKKDAIEALKKKVEGK